MMGAAGSAGLSGRCPVVIFGLALFLLSGCSSTPVQPGPDAATGADTAPLQAEMDMGTGAMRHALNMVGTPYRFGGNTPRDGFDCSGLVQYSYALAGMSLPRTLEQLLTSTRSVSMTRVRPGDLVFFHLDGKRNSHVGLYIGNGNFVHAPSTGKLVSTESLSNPFWSRHLAGARRPIFD